MPTSTAIQSRIAALEASARQSNVRPPSPTTPNVGNKSSPIDLHDWVLDDMPPSAPNLHFQPNSSPKLKPKPKPKPPALQVKSANGKSKSPPLPPRKNTQDSDTSLLYPPLGGVEAGNGENGRRGNHGQASSVSSFHSVSLSSDTDPGTPNSVGNMIATYPIDRVPSSSSLTESFEEISIPPPPLPQRPSSMTNSTYSYSSPSTPTPLPYVPRRVPPPPPSRASDRSSIQSSTSSSQSRRSSSSVQTPTLIATLPLPSALSPATPNTKRPTPVPSAARKRYIAVFNANIIQRRRAEVITANQPRQLTHAEAKRTRQAAGWRGLSVDLITATPEELEDVKGKYKEQDPPQVDGIIGPHDRLEGNIVKVIWSRSRIEKSKLAEIWFVFHLRSEALLTEPIIFQE